MTYSLLDVNYEIFKWENCEKFILKLYKSVFCMAIMMYSGCTCE